MRLDKYLKVTRLIKRRTIANEACDAGRVLVNGKVARASYEVKEDDILVVNGNEVAAFTAANSDGKVYKNVYGVHHMPNIAGSYISGREVENAFREVINNLVNAKETLYEYANNINNEIDRKRAEFGLPLADDEE